MNIEIYTDGSTMNNGKKDSYGVYGYVILVDGHPVYEDAQFVSDTTNNRMEAQAIIDSCKWILNSLPHKNVTIYSDSQYCVNCVMKWIDDWAKGGWKADKANFDLWKEVVALKQRMNIKMIWVKGHSTNEWNNYVDGLCTSVYDKLTSP